MIGISLAMQVVWGIVQAVIKEMAKN